MLDSFKTSLSHTHNLMWVIVALSTGLILIDPSAKPLTVLGFSVSMQVISLFTPAILIGLLMTRLLYIRNAAEIVRNTIHQSVLAEVVQNYPLVEFMHWKGDLESIFLFVMQAVAIGLPALALIAFKSLINPTGLQLPVADWIAVALCALLSARNYMLLRFNVYDPLMSLIKPAE